MLINHSKWFLFAVGCLLISLDSGNVFAQVAFDVKSFKLQPGFQAELIYEIPKAQGSWVSMTSEKNGRLIASDQNGGLFRITPAGLTKGEAGAGEAGSTTAPPNLVEPIDLKIGFAQGLLYAFDSLYVVAHAGNKFKTVAGLYRIRDKDGDDKYDSVELLRQFDGGGEHGPHAVVLGPDGKSLFICAGNHTRIPNPETSRMANRWDEDQILTRYPDANGHAAGVMAPGGWICKTDPDGKSFEMISAGYRNQYDIAFDPNGELFTYDADMEWDIGLPWYRPTRVCHATSGSEFGWRHGSGKWPEHYADSLPGILDVGPGSPTGIVFGTGARFPSAHQHSLFISDWSYGIIYQVKLQPQGSSYIGTMERFCSAPALPVTDLVINPADGAMYFMIGGRGLRSAMFRIKYSGTESTEPASFPAPSADVLLRRKLEAGHVDGASPDVETAWSQLKSPDRFLRFAARVVLEKAAQEAWSPKLENENDAQSILEGVLALVRTGKPQQQSIAVKKLKQLDWQKLSVDHRRQLCRVYALILIRMGGLGSDQQVKVAEAKLDEETRSAINELANHFPSGDELVDRELGRLAVATQIPSATEKLVNHLKKGLTQEDQIAYAGMLIDAQQGWTTALRESYFQWYLEAFKNQGGHSLSGYVRNFKDAAIKNLTEADRKTLAELLAKEPEVKDPYADLTARPLVKKWTMDDFQKIAEADFSKASVENGKKLFSVATCYKCHRIEGSGGFVGPDVTIAGHRYNSYELLETIIDPSKAVSDQYEATIFQLIDGRTVVGRVANLNGKNYMVQENLIKPGQFTNIAVDEIEAMRPSTVSLMPTGLLDTLSEQEIIDLLAYMKSTASKQGK